MEHPIASNQHGQCKGSNPDGSGVPDQGATNSVPAPILGPVYET